MANQWKERKEGRKEVRSSFGFFPINLRMDLIKEPRFGEEGNKFQQKSMEVFPVKVYEDFSSKSLRKLEGEAELRGVLSLN